MTIIRRPPIDRFREKYIVDEDSGCWIWTAYVGGWGYPGFNPGGSEPMVFGHRWAYEHFIAPIPEGHQVHHECGNPICVNPTHLETMTLSDHNRRHRKIFAINGDKTSCKRGHPFSEENTFYRRGTGYRMCRTCSRERTRRCRARKKAEDLEHQPLSSSV